MCASATSLLNPHPVATGRGCWPKWIGMGVGRALIYHTQAETLSPIEGNRYLQAWLGADGRLAPHWLVMPTEDSLAQIQSLVF